MAQFNVSIPQAVGTVATFIRVYVTLNEICTLFQYRKR